MSLAPHADFVRVDPPGRGRLAAGGTTGVAAGNGPHSIEESNQDVPSGLANAVKSAEEPRVKRVDPACVVASVPFREIISAETLAACLGAPGRDPFWDAHVVRFLEELPVAMVLAFCDRQGVSRGDLQRAFRYYRDRYVVRHPELQAFLDDAA